jgi:hypothetical protein
MKSPLGSFETRSWNRLTSVSRNSAMISSFSSKDFTGWSGPGIIVTTSDHQVSCRRFSCG